MNTPERKKLMNEPIENTPKDVQEQQRQGMLAQHGKSHRSLTYDDDDDKKRKRDDMPTEAMKKMRVLTEQVKSKKVEPSESNKRMQEMIVEKKPSETGGGFLEMFGLAGGRKRKSKRTKRMARKSRRRSRSRKKRGGFGCGSESKSDPRTPCPPIEKMWMGCDMGMLTACHSGRDAARGNSKSPDGGQMWYDYMYKLYAAANKKNNPKDMKKYAMRMKKFVEHLTKTKHRAMIPVTTDNAMKKGTGGESADWGWWSVPGSQNLSFEKSYEEKYTNMLRKTGLPDGRQNGHLPAPVPSNPQGAVGGRRRKSRRKKRRKSKKRKSRRRRKKSRRRRSRRRRR